MATAVSGIGRKLVLISALAVVGLIAPAAGKAEPPPPTPNLEVQIAKDLREKTSAAVEHDGEYELEVALIGLSAWAATTNPLR